MQSEIDLFTLNDEYGELYHSGIYLLTLKSIIKEVIDNLGMDSDKLKFLKRYSVYEDNSDVIVVATSLSMTPISNTISFRYH